jgi:hypothetical protein
MTDREAMQMALEALEEAVAGMGGSYAIWSITGKEAITALREALAQPQGEWVAWQPIETLKPTADELDILMGDGSVLCNVLTQADGDLWWGGSGTGEKFIDPEYAAVTHWRKHSDTTPPSVEAAVEATKEKAAKVCEEFQDKPCGMLMADIIRSMK